MPLKDKIQDCYKKSKSYPELVKNLIGIGIESYSVEVSSETILYRQAGGENFIQQGHSEPKAIAPKFDEEKTIQAIRDNQQGKTDYPRFLNDIAEAGVRSYEATLSGSNKRVTYIGIGGFYEEAIASV